MSTNNTPNTTLTKTKVSTITVVALVLISLLALNFAALYAFSLKKNKPAPMPSPQVNITKENEKVLKAFGSLPEPNGINTLIQSAKQTENLLADYMGKVSEPLEDPIGIDSVIAQLNNLNTGNLDYPTFKAKLLEILGTAITNLGTVRTIIDTNPYIDPRTKAIIIPELDIIIRDLTVYQTQVQGTKTLADLRRVNADVIEYLGLHKEEIKGHIKEVSFALYKLSIIRALEIEIKGLEKLEGLIGTNNLLLPGTQAILIRELDNLEAKLGWYKTQVQGTKTLADLGRVNADVIEYLRLHKEEIKGRIYDEVIVGLAKQLVIRLRMVNGTIDWYIKILKGMCPNLDDYLAELETDLDTFVDYIETIVGALETKDFALIEETIPIVISFCYTDLYMDIGAILVAGCYKPPR